MRSKRTQIEPHLGPSDVSWPSNGHSYTENGLGYARGAVNLASQGAFIQPTMPQTPGASFGPGPSLCLAHMNYESKCSLDIY